tara:strand:+ start:79 stop:186 length:108 start_codon:yes stop_codon:yes gene_type:complete
LSIIVEIFTVMVELEVALVLEVLEEMQFNAINLLE